MNKYGSANPLIRSGWLRSLLFLTSFFIAAGIVSAIYVLGIEKVSLDKTGIQSLMKNDKLLMVTGILFVLTFLITYVFRRWVDRKSFISLGLDFTGHGREAIAGGMLALFIVSASSLILKGMGNLKWMDIIFDPRTLFLAFGSIVISVFCQELIFRGYILNNLMDSFPKWLALGISTLLFAVFHNAGFSSYGFFTLAGGGILGLITGLNYIYTRNLWFSICFHTGWTFFAGPVLGVTGDASFQTLLQTDMHGDENITGGANGLEGSALLLGVSLLSLVALYLFLQKKISPRSQPVPGRI